MSSTPDLRLLREVVGPLGIETEEAAVGPYAMPARYAGGRAAAVVRPKDTQELSQVIGLCVRNRIPFIPQGGNTGLVQGSTPDASGRQIIVSLERLRTLDVDPADRTVVAGAGVRLSSLNRELLQHELCLPIDVSSDPMIGGMVSTNTGGSRYLRYGDMRRHVLGLQVVLPDEFGTILPLSSGLRKDNTHLDLKSIFTGSSGALGIVSAATLEVHRRPKQLAAAFIVPRSVDAVGDLLSAFEEWAGDYLSAFEGISQAALQQTFKHIAGLRNPFAGELPEYVVLVELASTAPIGAGGASLDNILMAVVERIASADPSPVDNVYFGESGRFWQIRHSLSEALKRHGQVIGLDLSFRRNRVFRFRSQAHSLLASDFPDFSACDFGHIGDGGLHYNLVCRRPFSADEASEVRRRIVELAVSQFEGSFSAEHGIGRSNAAEYLEYIPQVIRSYSSEVAHVFTKFPSANAVIGT